MNCNVAWGELEHRSPVPASYIAVSITGSVPCQFCICEVHREMIRGKVGRLWAVGKLPRLTKGFATFADYGRFLLYRESYAGKEAAREAKRVIKNSLRSPSDGDIVNRDTCHESPAVDQKRAKS